jgi:HEAT repeat protein
MSFQEEALASEDANVRRMALAAWVDEEDEAAIPALTRALRSDPADEVRVEAARLLEPWGTAEAVDALAAALLDASAPVRQAAAQSLSELKNPAVGERLLPWAGHPLPEVRAAALRGLRELRLPAAAEPALQALHDEDAAVRREAVGVLGWLKWQSALPLLAQLAQQDPAAEVRRIAAGALGLAAEPGLDGAVAALVRALQDPAWTVREEAATTLGRLKAASAVEALLQTLDDAYWQVRLRAARALGRLKDARALPGLQRSLLHPIANLRKEAAIALGELGQQAAVPALQAAAGDVDPEVRKAARVALSTLEAAAAAHLRPA